MEVMQLVYTTLVDALFAVMQAKDVEAARRIAREALHSVGCDALAESAVEPVNKGAI